MASWALAAVRQRYLKAEGKRLRTPADWAYVNTLDGEPVPAGGAAAFIADINGLVDNLVATFPAVPGAPDLSTA